MAWSEQDTHILWKSISNVHLDSIMLSLCAYLVFWVDPYFLGFDMFQVSHCLASLAVLE